MIVLHKGDSGPLVNAVQQKLIEAGYPIPLGTEDGIYQEGTYHAILAFQASHVGPDGQPLAEDGVCGSNTLWALDHRNADINGKYTVDGWRCEPSEVREAVRPVIVAAVGELGNFEWPDGSNSGPTIDKYGQKKQPWCAYFLSWLFNRLPQGSPFGTIGSAWGLYDWAVGHGRVLGATVAPLPGDFFVVLRPKNPVTGERHGHTGCLVNVANTGFCTVEGNSSNAVRGVLRQRDGVSAIIRPIPL